MRDSLRRIANQVRGIPGIIGIRPYTVSVVVSTWSGTYAGAGVETQNSSTAITEQGQPPKVRFLDHKELALNSLPAGSVEIGPITPDHSGGGTALSVLKPTLSSGKTVFLVLTGPEFPSGARFQITNIKTDRALHWLVTARPVGHV